MSFNPQERQYFDQLFDTVDKSNAGVLPGQDVFDFLLSSKLPQQTLGEIWALSDPDNNGFLTKDGWYKAARLIGWMQKGGVTLDDSLMTKSGPLPTFTGQPPPPQTSAIQTSSLPSITPADRTKFTRIFVGCSPQNGLVSGDKARDVFIKSQLGYDQLGQIWNLADTQSRGSLDLADFIIGMFLIQSAMANPSLNLPATLPSGLYEQASGGRAPTSPISRQNTGPTSPLRTMTLQPQSTGPSLQSQTTGQSQISTGRWDVTPEAKAASDRFFTTLDTANRGVIEGDVAVPFMLQSQLDEASLATIWDLADIRQEGKLTRDEFAVAMYLINAKLGGTPVPTSLPPSLIPPSLRGDTKDSAKDLFDLFDDPPRVTAPPRQSQPPPARQPQPPTPRVALARSPPSDLLGDDNAPAPTASADIGNKQNELANTTRSVSELEKTQADLEKTAANSSTTLAELETKLSEAKSKHETVSKSVADLRVRVSEQSSRQKTLESEVIAAESDLSAMKSEKTELEQALMRDKEEVRGLQKMMKEVDEEKATLKVTLEKLRKDTRQQKGMVTIAKKQLSTAEGSRDAVQTEIDKVSSSIFEPSPPPAANIPLPVTPQALSPAPTGVSQRSNNPFERLRGLQPEKKTETRSEDKPNSTLGDAGIFGAVGAVTGLVAAGAETVYHAAKDAITQESDGGNAHEASTAEPEAEARAVDSKSSTLVEEKAPAQAPSEAESVSNAHDSHSDPFGAQTDPFGAPSGSNNDFDDGFADSFGKVTEPKPSALGDGFADSFASTTEPAPTSSDDFTDSFTKTTEPAAKPVASFDDEFDDAFAAPAQPLTETLIKQHDQEPINIEEEPVSLADAGVPSGVPASALPAHLRPEPERSASTQAVPPISRPETPAEPLSSDDDDEPEDLERPSRDKGKQVERSISPLSEPSHADEVHPIAMGAPILAPPTDTKARRSAPPPPARSVNDFDPFGASVPSTLPPGAAPANHTSPRNANFDDEDDFDFSDLPPAKVENTSQPTSLPPTSKAAFDDEFAGFDDDFEKPSGSDNSGASKSYEMVPPPPPSDPWGVGQTTNAPSSAFSFDDAFGGSFDHSQQYAPPSGPPPAATLSPPALPTRRESQPQADDLDDVKKLCAMGFSRSLAIEALDANDYNFQKALNVLLQ